MVQYYVFPAPRLDLFKDLNVDDISRPDVLPFAEMRCAATKYTEGMTLDQVRKKIEVQWVKELTKPRSKCFRVKEEMAKKALAKCLHAYVVLEDTAKNLLELKKSWTLHIRDDLPETFYRYRLFSYLNMLICMRAEGTWVEILTDGKESWLTSEDKRLRDATYLMSKTHMIYHRLTTDETTSEKT